MKLKCILKVTDEFIFEQAHSNADSDANATYVESALKLTSNKSLTNIHLYNGKNQIQKYDTIYKFRDEHYAIRYNLYQERQTILLNILKNTIWFRIKA